MEKKNIIIVILSILVVVLSGYIVYDKVFSDNDNAEDNQLIKTENAEFFDEYLKVFLPGKSANNFKKTIEELYNNINNF